jgi:hypothetical protein
MKGALAFLVLLSVALSSDEVSWSVFEGEDVESDSFDVSLLKKETDAPTEDRSVRFGLSPSQLSMARKWHLKSWPHKVVPKVSVPTPRLRPRRGVPQMRWPGWSPVKRVSVPLVNSLASNAPLQFPKVAHLKPVLVHEANVQGREVRVIHAVDNPSLEGPSLEELNKQSFPVASVARPVGKGRIENAKTVWKQMQMLRKGRAMLKRKQHAEDISRKLAELQ